MPSAFHLDPELIRRYDQDGPRYTSYPTAPHFHEQFGEADFRAFARQSNDALIPSPLSLYLHIPFCFSPCFYCGCNRLITRDLSKGHRYLERLFREIEMVSPLFERGREVLQVHLGGGTPNFLSTGQLGGLMGHLARQFYLTSCKDRDFSIELDPRHVSGDDIARLSDAGFNRASLGVQDFDPEVQAAINRQQSVEETLGVIEACRDAGFRSVNVDLIYGLPRQSLGGFRKTLNTVIAARPDRLAVYGYAHLPQMFKAQRQFDHDDLPKAETRLALLASAVELLESAGYRYIGLDHFALPGDDLSVAQDHGSLHRNFMGYTTHAECDLVGLGVSAISHVYGSFSQNHRDLGSWQMAIDRGHLPVWRGLALGFDDELRGFVIQALMCQAGIQFSTIERRFGIEFGSYFADELVTLATLAEDGLLDVSEEAITVTDRGRYLLRIIAMTFDRYRQTGSRPESPASSAI
ncbi:MAG: oxygen-independent coproporphyrinogen III oxidase [Xanthomonadales bacterium]|nr:oxygen-independent coproporphyrinogen III oxidase [Xanthomonadales bacterium]